MFEILGHLLYCQSFRLGIFFNQNLLICFLISPWNIGCRYSVEVPQQGTSNEYPQVMFHGEIKKEREKNGGTLLTRSYMLFWFYMYSKHSLIVNPCLKFINNPPSHLWVFSYTNQCYAFAEVVSAQKISTLLNLMSRGTVYNLDLEV